MHAARVHARLKGRAATYKFSRRSYRSLFDRAFAVDARNVEQLAAWGTPPQRIERVGNLAIDGALFEAGLTQEPGTPGRRHPDHARLAILRNRKSRPVLLCGGFAHAAGAPRAEDCLRAFAVYGRARRLRAAIEGGGHPRMFGRRGRLVTEAGRDFLATDSDDVRIPLLNNALSAARSARLVLTIPGTKTIELAVLGKPVIAITPLNAPELVAINGPLTYLNRVPLVGVPLKRAAAVAVSRRFRYHTQPNMDAGASLIREVHGTVTPGRIARIALDCVRRPCVGLRRPARHWRRSIATTSARPTGWRSRCSAWRHRTEMDYSVVIATKDRQEYLRRTLESLARQIEAPPFEVIVVDNGSTDGTRSVVEARAEARSGSALRCRAAAQSRQSAQSRRRACGGPVHRLLRRRRIAAARLARRSCGGADGRRLRGKRADSQRALLRRNAQAGVGQLLARVSLHVQRIALQGSLLPRRRIRRKLRSLRLGGYRVRRAPARSEVPLEVCLGCVSVAHQATGREHARNRKPKGRRKGAHGGPLSR